MRSLVAIVAALLPTIVEAQAPRTQARIIDLASGSSRPVLADSIVSGQSSWSPDGRILAVQALRDGRITIALVSLGDGAVRWLALPEEPANAAMRWSPDSRALVYGAANLRKAVIVNIAEGTARVAASSDSTNMVAFWKSDGRALLLRKKVATSGSTVGHFAIFETDLAGHERLVRDVGAELSQLSALAFVSDREVEFAHPDPAGQLTTDRWLVPLPSGPARRIPVEGRATAPGESRDHQWLLFRKATLDGKVASADLVNIANDSVRSIPLSFSAIPHPKATPVLDRARNVSVFVGNDRGKFQLVLVPLDGTPPRTLAELDGDPRGVFLELSPDGRSVAFAVVRP
jgi:Tol biopolymer transport system component